MRFRPARTGPIRATALAALATLAIAGTALAGALSKPEKGKTYAGTIKSSGTSISFKVSKTGRSVSRFKIEYAPFIFCQGGGVTMKSRSAKVSGKGTFTAKLPLRTVAGNPKGHMKVTGTFAKGGQETGKVVVDMKAVPPGCNGSSPYSTKAG